MSYTTVAAAVLDLVQGVAGFDATNATLDDWLALDARGTTQAAVIQQADASRYGPEVATAFAGAYGEHGEDTALHSLSVTVAVRRGQGQGGDGAVFAALHDLADTVVAALLADPTLGDTVVQAQAVSASRPGDLLRPGATGPGAAVGKRIIVQVLETL